ncbi:MAG: hypothetical protein Q9170_007421 [Blastenia crenularia]
MARLYIFVPFLFLLVSFANPQPTPSYFPPPTLSSISQSTPSPFPQPSPHANSASRRLPFHDFSSTATWAVILTQHMLQTARITYLYLEVSQNNRRANPHAGEGQTTIGQITRSQLARQAIGGWSGNQEEKTDDSNEVLESPLSIKATRADEMTAQIAGIQVEDIPQIAYALDTCVCILDRLPGRSPFDMACDWLLRLLDWAWVALYAWLVEVLISLGLKLASAVVRMLLIGLIMVVCANWITLIGGRSFPHGLLVAASLLIGQACLRVKILARPAAMIGLSVMVLQGIGVPFRWAWAIIGCIIAYSQWDEMFTLGPDDLLGLFG